MVSRLAIVGTGLVGASVGLAAKRAGVDRIAGYDADGEALELAAERGAVDVSPGAARAMRARLLASMLHLYQRVQRLA